MLGTLALRELRCCVVLGDPRKLERDFPEGARLLVLKLSRWKVFALSIQRFNVVGDIVLSHACSLR